MDSLKTKIWWEYLEHDLQELLNESLLLVDILEGMGVELPKGKSKFHDYSFVVFASAKAYEGFLKKAFLDLGFITEDDYFGKHFRIGMALNPSLPRKLKKYSVYGKIEKYCGGGDLAETLWETWKYARNYTFHWFPNEKNAISFKEARQRVDMVIKAIDRVFKDCNLNVASK